MNWKTVAFVILVIIVLVLAMTLALARRDRRRQWTGGAADSFPYWSKSLPPAKEMFADLKEALFTVTPTGEGPILTRTYPDDYRRTDAISNHYTEEARLECRSGRTKTPREAWEEMAPRYAHPGGGAAVYRTLREKVYSATRECNIFNPAFVSWVLGETVGSGAKVLDPSSGWGDRLIGALAAGAKCYHGYDPNPRLQAGYKKIVEELGRKRHKDFRVTEAPFEEADASLRAGGYDIAFTSPPYYAYEEYVAPGGEGEAAQSIGRYPDYESWAAKMYRPYLANAYRAVRPGGWVVLYIEDIRLGGESYPLRRLTEEIMEELGAKPATRFGLQVTPSPSAASVAGGGRRGQRPKQQKAPRVRWALSWLKCSPPTATELSPPFELEDVVLGDHRTLRIVRDDRLYAGTKQRGLAGYAGRVRAAHPGLETILYTGGYNGYGPVAAALIARLTGSKARLILDLHAAASPRAVAPQVALRATPVARARCLDASIEFVRDWGEMNARGAAAATESGTFWAPLGFGGEDFVEPLATAIAEAAAQTAAGHPRRVWVAGGSGTIALALSRAFPDTNIHVVPVTTAPTRLKKLELALAAAPRVTLWRKPVRRAATPYPTVQGYDSLAWSAAVEAAEDGDWVWNVGG